VGVAFSYSSLPETSHSVGTPCETVVNCNMRVGIKFHIAYNLLSYEYLRQFFTRRDQSGGTGKAAELRVRQCIERNNWTLFFLKTDKKIKLTLQENQNLNPQIQVKWR